ncbi:hypothetical protein GGS23DRAFT_449119 [Durotheca rogersii]|uniref:uncharacterized protein n=1 Tax=Durotheca rogersii TaxID=419775 RepID=UPI0022210C2F|nr:uncharacterized protein GGS23DRAFT_449119 [Durotheca rogersii]KAI5864485.1 hypothetical protein GGS23DRAFT_449119 [Durotheca rogersii]
MDTLKKSSFCVRPRNDVGKSQCIGVFDHGLKASDGSLYWRLNLYSPVAYSQHVMSQHTTIQTENQSSSSSAIYHVRYPQARESHRWVRRPLYSLSRTCLTFWCVMCFFCIGFNYYAQSMVGGRQCRLPTQLRQRRHNSKAIIHLSSSTSPPSPSASLSFALPQYSPFFFSTISADFPFGPFAGVSVFKVKTCIC